LHSEEDRRNGAPMNGAINWDYFTDWGPSFEKLVGVFKDIASLPDGDETTNSNKRSLHLGQNRFYLFHFHTQTLNK
jgi:hypothetical protein